MDLSWHRPVWPKDRFTRRYVPALLILAVLMGAAQLAVTGLIESQQLAARQVNVAGRQRMLTERVALRVGMLAARPGSETGASDTSDTNDTSRTAIVAGIDADLQQLTQDQRGLLDGDARLNLPRHPSAEIVRLYRGGLDAELSAYIAAARRVADRSATGSIQGDPDVALIQREALGHLLAGLDRATLAFQHESERVVGILERRMYAILGLGLLVVAGQAFLVFRPLARAVRRESALLRAAQQASAAQAELFSTVFQSMTEGFVVVDPNGRSVVSNPAASALTGMDLAPGNLIGPVTPAATPVLCYPDGQEIPLAERPLVQALGGAQTTSMDVVVRTENASDAKTLEVYAAPVPGRIGGGAFMMFRDVTDDRRHRDELAMFAGVVAHDLLNPLGAIVSSVDLMSAELDLARPDPVLHGVAETLTWIQDSALRVTTMISELLTSTTARDAPVKAEDVDLRAVLDDVIASRSGPPRPDGGAGSDANAGIAEFEIHPLGRVHADPLLLRQLFDNLIANAVKYTQHGVLPKITVEAEPGPANQVTVTISDRGIGIPAGQHEAIFENFHRAHGGQGYTGTGIGLALCQRIVQRHGGSLTAADNPGGGTRFSFTLPAAIERAAVSEEPAGQPVT